jgi:hypothetical protein
MNKPTKLWHTLVASMISGIAVGLVILLFSRAGQHSDNNEAILSQKANITDVTKQGEQIISYVDKQDKSIKDDITSHEIADEQKEKVLMEFIRNMNTNISDIKADIRVIKNK